MGDLLACYENLKSILGDEIEPYESVELVEQYRQFWKPSDVKILLLAESHVFTSDEDRRIRIPRIFGLSGYPREYAKFVYCLGYGERQLTNSHDHPRRDGTPQFWKIFYGCNRSVKSNSDFSPVLGSTKFKRRLRNKIALLKDLKEKGIWLVDSSIVALYHGGKKPSHNKMRQVIHSSWANYVGDAVEGSRPEHVVVIGKGVASVVGESVRDIVGSRFSVISQPNAHLSAEEHLENYRTYYRICSGT